VIVAYKENIVLPNQEKVHKAIITKDGSEITYKTVCGKKGKYFPRWKSKKPVDCRRCLRSIISKM